jgi:L-rhamnose-H+ transport protein
LSAITTCGFGLVIVAGALAGGCAAPIKLMRRYRFEHWALVAALVGQVLLPWTVTLAACPGALGALGTVGAGTLLRANLLSLAWGIANVLCGLCLVRIGFSLSVGLLTGIGLPIGVLLPLLWRGSGEFAEAPGLGTPSGLLILAGVAGLLVAVALIALAGLGRDAAQGGGRSAGFRSGLIMVSVAGVLQVGLSFAFVYSQGPIVAALMARGAGAVPAGLGVWAATLPGGALVNVGFPLWLLVRNRSAAEFAAAPRELALSALIGVGFFLLVLAMGTGMRWMGALGASVGFGVYQAAQIAASQAVGFFSGEWHGVEGRPRRRMIQAIAVLLLAVGVIAAGRAVQ